MPGLVADRHRQTGPAPLGEPVLKTVRDHPATPKGSHRNGSEHAKGAAAVRNDRQPIGQLGHTDSELIEW